jgi:hypothetical protein
MDRLASIITDEQWGWVSALKNAIEELEREKLKKK